MNLYDSDYYEWTRETADALRRGEFATLDIASLVEEVEDLGKRERSAIESRFTVLLAHLLEWDSQASKRSRSRQASIELQRTRIERLLRQSPSLRPYLVEILGEAYAEATLIAVKETGLARKSFPAECAYSLDEALRGKSIALEADER